MLLLLKPLSRSLFRLLFFQQSAFKKRRHKSALKNHWFNELIEPIVVLR